MSIEYAYDKNGNLIRDDNKGMTFTYDLLGHPLTIAGSDNQTDYVYSADGRKLRATHTQYISRTSTAVKTRVKTDYRGRIVANDGSNIRFLFDGGFYTFKNGALDVCHYFIQDYQGNNRILIGSNGQRDQYSHYYPYGGLMGDISTNDAHSYKYGGKELDRDYGIDLFDFEARQYDAKVPGFTSIDPLAEKYYGISPYAYCAGDPVNLVDPTGESIYMLFYTTGNSGGGDNMFLAAAQTRKVEIENGSNFDPEKDIVIIQNFKDVSQIQSLVENIVDQYSEEFGKTQEFGVWSHAGIDGPTGTVPTSQNAVDDKQMTLQAWSEINFNWESNATASFYGCYTGVDQGNGSFASNISEQTNFQGVTVAGQTNKAYPSSCTNRRIINTLNYFGFFSIPTYMVGWPEGHGIDSKKLANPMRYCKNGRTIYYQWQEGIKR